MEIRQHYSIAIYPPKVTSELLDAFKKTLADYIGWYPSKNSKPHFTINEFKADDREIEIVHAFLKSHCDTQKAFNVNLNGFKTYKHGTFFVSPDDQSKTALKGLMKGLKEKFPVKPISSSSDPHLSIARQLDEQSIKIASKVLQEVQTDFYCDEVVLRVFNPVKQQYDVLDTYHLNGLTNGGFGQLALW